MSPSTLHDDRGQCHRSVVIQAGDNRLLGNRDDGGFLKAGGNHRQSKGETEDVFKHLYLLVGTRSEDTAMNTIMTRCFAWVDRSK